VLGLTFKLPEVAMDEEIQGRIETLIEERTAARKEKNWKLADEIRNKLDEMGIVLEDGPAGTTWKQKR
jgi:cysteinyl-tRNA synthetase